MNGFARQAVCQCAVAMVASSLVWTGAHGAELVRGAAKVCDWTLQGEILAGDQKHVSETVLDGSSICLNSPGGDYMEGLALFRYFAEVRIATVVQQGHRCASACAIAFMGGAEGKYGDRFPKRTLIAGAQLGFHSPFVNDADVAPQLLSKGVVIGIAVVAALLRSDKYRLMPPDLTADMLETKPDDLYVIETLAKAKKLNIAVDGISTPKAITTTMLYQACINTDPWMDKHTGPIDPKEISRRNVSDKPGLYRVEFGPGGFGFKAMESCAVSVFEGQGAPPQLVVDLGYVPQDQSLLQQPPNKTNEKPLWYLLSLQTRIDR